MDFHLPFQFNSQDTSSKIGSVLLLTYLCLIPLTCFWFFRKYLTRLEDEPIESRFSSLYLNLRTDSLAAVRMPVLFFVRRLIYAISIVWMGSAPLVQAVIQVLSSFCMLVFIVKCKPFKKMEDYFFEIINEASLLSCSYFLIVFCRSEDSGMKYKIGWYIVAITLLNLLVNYVNLVVNLAIEVCKKIRKQCEKRNQQKAKKESQNISQVYEINQNDNQGMRNTSIADGTRIEDLNENEDFIQVNQNLSKNFKKKKLKGKKKKRNNQYRSNAYDQVIPKPNVSQEETKLEEEKKSPIPFSYFGVKQGAYNNELGFYYMSRIPKSTDEQPKEDKWVMDDSYVKQYIKRVLNYEDGDTNRQRKGS